MLLRTVVASSSLSSSAAALRRQSAVSLRNLTASRSAASHPARICAGLYSTRRGPSLWSASSVVRSLSTNPPIRTKFDLPDPTGNGHNHASNGTSPDSTARRWSPPLTKIVATIGPASEQLDVLQQVVQGGMRIMRLNFSHATKDEVELRTTNLSLCRGLHTHLPMNGGEKPTTSNLRAILLDTRGPEIRSGKLRNDHSGKETIELQVGNTITLRTDPDLAEQGSTTDELYIDYDHLHLSLHPGMKVLLDDGAVALQVEQVESDKQYHGTVKCRVLNSGRLRSRAGVNLPGAETDLPAMSDKDKADIMYGLSKDVDFVAASFIQNADNVHEIRRYLADCAKELKYTAPLPLLISKIETVSALKHFDDILAASDGIMVARGDLGVELPIQQVTNAQKEMVAACNAVGKPVIVATQMLESMANSPRPTRAEVSDVTNAVYDGADCVMLSGETAKGSYPVESVCMMDEIIRSAEGYSQSGGIGAPQHKPTPFHAPPTPDAGICKAAVAAAQERGAAAILVLTTHGTLAPLLSAFRPDVPILAFCSTAKMGRQLMLHRGIHPIVGLEGVSFARRPEVAVKDAKAMGFIHSGDDVVIVTTEDYYEGLQRTATMKIATVP